MLDNPPPDLKVGQYLQGIDRGSNRVARGLDQVTEFGNERREFMRRGRGRLVFIAINSPVAVP
jgi:hypothetical protein